jgi:hypothetical protein
MAPVRNLGGSKKSPRAASLDLECRLIEEVSADSTSACESELEAAPAKREMRIPGTERLQGHRPASL